MHAKLVIVWLSVAVFFMTASVSLGGDLQRANKKLDQQKFEEAVPLYKAYLEKKPKAVEARSRLGFAYLKTGQMDAAIREFEQVLRAKPGEPFSILYLGLAHLNKGQIGETIRIWQGYRDKSRTAVENEIKRQLTLLQIAESQRLAKKALLEEERLNTVAPDANTIAVSYFKDLSSSQSLRPFQKGLTAMVTTDLSKIKSLKVLERVRLQVLMEEMNLGPLGIVDEQTAPRLGRLLRVKDFVVGTIRKGSIEVVTTVNAQSGVLRVKEKHFWKISPGVIKTVTTALNIRLTWAEKRAIGKVHTKKLKAFIYYGQALMAQDAGNWKKAKNLFLKALKEDPVFDLAQLGADGCPDATAPTTSALSSMSTADLATAVQGALDNAQAAASPGAAAASGGRQTSDQADSGGDGDGGR